MLKPSNNTLLPEAPAYGVKSFWLLLITVLITACNAMGFDLTASLCEVGLGCTADAIGAKAENAVGLVQQLLPILTSVWLWFERRAPNFRLVFWRKANPGTIGSLLFGVVCASAFMLGSTPRAMASACGEPEAVDATLRQTFGETVVARGLADDVRPTLLYVNEETGSWTLVVLIQFQASAVASGSDWKPSLDLLGEPT